jgi:tetratricopeptide (TPR) repeat protein
MYLRLREQLNDQVHRRGRRLDLDMEEVLASAIKYHQAGNLVEAERLYRTIVAERPTHAGALRHLGILAGQIGKPLVAVQLFSLAIEAAPREATYYNDLGNALKACGNLQEAEASYKAAIAFNAGYADAHFNLGNVCRLQGNFSAAIASYERAIALSPLEADAHNNLGTAWLDMGQTDKAERAFLRAIELNPWYAEAHFNRGNAFASKGDHVEAIECFDLALKMRANQPKAYVNRGISETALGDAKAGTKSFEQAIELAPLDAVAHNNLGMALLETGDRAQAVLAFQRAIELDPAYAEAHFNLGNAVGSGEGGDLARGIQCFNQSIAIRPGYAKALQNRGTSEEALGDLDAAIGSYREALACDPENREVLSNLGQVLAFKGDAQGVAYLEELVEDAAGEGPDAGKAHWNLGLALLLQGDYERGFKEYEWRWKCKDWSPRAFFQPQWTGEPLGGKTILLHAEQGQGDTLQFVRYAPLVAQRGGRVVIEVQDSLERLLKGHPGISGCVRQGDRLPEFSVHCPLMSLPAVFGTNLQTVPPAVAYEEMRYGAKEGTKTRVGLVWSGNPEHPRNRLRAVPLAEFTALLRTPLVEFVSLQKGLAAEDARGGLIPFHEPDRIRAATDFADTAKLIASLDLVITVDTAVAHLAGTMGKPVWILISNFPDWRWGLQAETTPWYPTARLFRQRMPRKWGDVMIEVASALKVFAAQRRRLFERGHQYAEGGQMEILDRMGAIAQ